MERSIPLTSGTPGKAEDVGDLVLFLASDASKHITGTEIWIDGCGIALNGVINRNGKIGAQVRPV